MPEKMKIEVGFNKIARTDDLDLLTKLLFPSNRIHRLVFLAIFVELKWAERKPVPMLDFIMPRYGFGKRSFEKVRSRLRIAGIIEHVSRFSPRFGYREGWILSSRFSRSLRKLAEQCDRLRSQDGENQEEKDRYCLKLCQNIDASER